MNEAIDMIYDGKVIFYEEYGIVQYRNEKGLIQLDRTSTSGGLMILPMNVIVCTKEQQIVNAYGWTTD